jgi:hypothetical protein
MRTAASSMSDLLVPDEADGDPARSGPNRDSRRDLGDELCITADHGG